MESLISRMEAARKQYLEGVTTEDEYINFVFAEIARYHGLIRVPLTETRRKEMN